MTDVTDRNNNEDISCSEDPEDEDPLSHSKVPIKPRRCVPQCNGNCSPLASEEITINHHFKVLKLYHGCEECDAILRTTDGGVFRIHRAVLMAGSEYFRALFTTSLHIHSKRDVLIHDIRADLMQLILHYLYTHKVTITNDIVLPVLEAADYLSVVALRDECTKYIEDRICAQNVLSIRRYAKERFCHDLWKRCQAFLMRCFIEVARESDEILELRVDEVLEVFGNDELNVKNEEVVWEAAMRWVEKDPEIRKHNIVDLLKQVRTGLMETQYFMERVKDHPYVHGNEGCRPIVIETLRFLYDLEVITERDGEVKIPTPSIAKPRIPHEILFALGGWSGGSPTSYIETYDTRADRWIRVDEVDPAGPRAYHGTVSLGYEIFVIGGFDGVDYFNSCRVFSAVTKTWRNISPMRSKRCYVSVALLGKFIYALGGYDGNHRQNTCERYDPEDNLWINIEPMIFQRSDASATALNDHIYICGGFNGIECLNSCECYSPETNQWTQIAAMRSRRSGVSCIGYHGSIYVIGGFNGISRMSSGEKFSPETNTWTSMPDMYNPRSNFAIEVIDDLLFCIGGFTGTSTTYNVECYDERSNEWYEATDMNIFRSALSACVIAGLPNMYDYIHQHRDRLMEEKRQRLLVLQQQQQQQQRS